MRNYQCVLLGALIVIQQTQAFYPITTQLPAYTLSYDYSGANFYNNFRFFDGPDPTNSHVKYVDFETANATGLAGFINRPNSNNTQTAPSLSSPIIYLGVDNLNTAPEGRSSIRVSSIQTFNHGLIIADILHMPSPTCGVWPAFWLLGNASTWPTAGEVDILENVNLENVNLMTLHTTEGITTANYTGTSQMRGHLDTANCDVNAPGQPKNAGCSVTDAPSTGSYGDAFNDNGGGVFATLIDDLGVRIWFFDRSSIPTDITANSPNPPARELQNSQSSGTGSSSSSSSSSGNSTWPAPNARFDGPNNDIAAHFRDLQIIFNIAFCGDWAGSENVWNKSGDGSCASVAPTCKEYVTSNPDAFADVYWAIAGVKVFEPSLESGHGLGEGVAAPYPPFPGELKPTKPCNKTDG